MAAKVRAASGITVKECTAPFYDAWSVNSVRCTTDKNENITVTTPEDAAALAKSIESFSGGGWKVYAGPNWVVAAGSRQATLDAAVAALMG